MRKRKQKPIFENIEVIDAGAKGKTIAKAPDGRVVFISNAVPGDVVDVQTFKKRKAYFEGTAVNFHKRSEKRTQPICEHFGVCGGCKWQHMGYEHQLYYKQREVENNLKRIGGIQLPEILPILGSKNDYFYRNKMEFSFSDSRWLTQAEINSDQEITNREALGFHIPGMWDKILDIKKCHLQEDPSNTLRNAIKRFAVENQLSFFNPKKQQGLLRTLMIRTASTGEIMVLIQFFEDDKKKRELLLDYLKKEFPQLTALLYVINQKQNDTIYDQNVICYAGRDHIFEEMEGLRFKINAKSFYQTNSQQAYEFFVGDMKSIFTTEFIQQHGQPDVVITDPPRDGMHKKVVEQLLNVLPKKIVYVSCNSATQARDLSLMNDAYKVVKVQAVDMFPQTHHVENVVLLEKRN